MGLGLLYLLHCLVDLSAAFDTTDHNILLSHLSSWFGMAHTVLNLFESYLSARPFGVRCENSFSPLHTCFSGVPRGFVLGSFLSCTPPVSVHSSNLFSISHHLYADDTQLFFSFHPSNTCIHSIITHLHCVSKNLGHAQKNQAL